MLFSVLVHCQKRGVQSVADYAILAPVACKKNGRLQPEFAVSVRRPDMDMGRLTSLVGVEVKTERSDAHNCRHAVHRPNHNIVHLPPRLFAARPKRLQKPPPILAIQKYPLPDDPLGSSHGKSPRVFQPRCFAWEKATPKF